MAEIIQNPAPVEQSTGILQQIFSIIANYWWVLLIFALFIAVCVVAWMIWKKKEENDRRRDSAVYATAMNYWESAEQNARSDWKRKKYSLMNLLWLGIPFKWNEHSVRLIDVDRNLLGYYRGHTRTQGGDIIFLLYKTKFFLFFEEKFLLYCPLKITVPKVNMKEAKGTKTTVQEASMYTMPIGTLVFDTEKGNEIRLHCNTITKQGNYYRFPNYVFNTESGGKEYLDLTSHISANIAKTNHLVSLEQAYADMSRAMGKAIELNASVRAEQKIPEKEKSIEENARPQV